MRTVLRISYRALIFRMIRCCRAVCSPISTPSFLAWDRPIFIRSRSTRRSVLSRTISAMDTCRWRNRAVAWPTSQTLSRRIPRAKRRRASARSQHPKPESKDESGRKASPTTTARHASSTAVKPSMNKRTSRRRWCLNSPRSARCTFAKRWSVTCGISTKTWRNASRTDCRWRNCHHVPRRPPRFKTWTHLPHCRSSAR